MFIDPWLKAQALHSIRKALRRCLTASDSVYRPVFAVTDNTGIAYAL
jgi:hypothetical protein